MKKSLLLVLFISQFVFNFILRNEISAQTATTTVTYTGFQACGGCTVCGADYWCFNTVSSYCGNTVPCGTTTFVDPCPPGSIVTSVTVNYFSASCAGGSMTATIDGNAVPTVFEGNTGCLCSNAPCAQSASSSATYPCGLPGYVNGGINSLQMCTGASVCINRLVLVFTYAPASQATPATLPATPSGSTSVCAGTTYTYSVPPVNASNYAWTVPPGWVINSGQGTTSITATPGSAGNICVVASNLCGSSASSCVAVSIITPSVAPTGATATPNPICPSTPTTLSVSGGSLGAGASWNWYTGSCGGTLIGTGSSIVVSPASSTTYFVGAVGTCNVTACASVLVTVSGITPAPGAPSGSTSICNGSTQTYSTTGSAGATSYNWTVPVGTIINSGSGTTSISVTVGSSSGNICVTATGPCGTSSPSCTPITISTLPVATFSYTGTPYCQDAANPSPTFSGGGGAGTFTASPAGLSIDPTTGIVNLAASTAGTYTVTNTIAASGGCPAVVATSNITITPLPVATFAYTGTPYCQDAANPSPTYSGGGVAGNFTASPAGLSIDPTTGVVNLAASTAGTYTITNTIAAVSPCGAVVATSNITINTVQNAAFGYSSLTYCQTGTDPTPTITGTLGGVFSSSPAGLVFISTTTGEVDLSASTLNTYTITYTTPGPCAGSLSVNLTITTAPSASFSYATPFCQGGANPLPIFGVGASAGVFSSTAGLLFVSASTGEINLATSTPGTYTVSNDIAAAGGCAAATATTLITINAAPTITNATTASVCSGSALNITLTGSVASTYTWIAADNSNTTGESITSQITGTINDIITATSGSSETVVYTVTLLSSLGCSNTTPQTITITVNPSPTMTNVTTATICSGTALNIALTGSVASTYTWVASDNINTTGESITNQVTATINDIITNTTISPQTVVYDVTLLSTVGSCINTTPQTITVTVNPLPVVDSSSIIITPANCGLSTGSISGIIVASGIGPFTYVWQNALGDTVGTNLNLTNVGPGSYFLTITDSNNCSTQFGSGSGIVITPSSVVIAAFTANPTTGETPLIVNFTNGSTGATSYLWQFGTGDTSSVVNPIYTYTPLGNFTVCLMASNIAGCADTACSTIDVYVSSVFIIPNVFSPNGDNVNDVFAVQAIGLKTLDAEVYNRWGQKEYEWHTTNGGWDGHTSSGILAADGTYYFIINAKGIDGKEYFEKGYFMLVR